MIHNRGSTKRGKRQGSGQLLTAALAACGRLLAARSSSGGAPASQQHMPTKAPTTLTLMS